MSKQSYTAYVITVSDKAYRGERNDKSGPAVAEFLKQQGFEVVEQSIVPDEKELIIAKLMHVIEVIKVDLCLTTGGTGFSPRDVTPEATLSVIERHTPGVAECIRRIGSEITPHAILSRGICGIRGKTVILNLPGSPKGAVESLGFVIGPLKHGIDVLKGNVGEHG